MPQIASFSLRLTIFCAVYVIVASVIALKTGSSRWMASAIRAFYAIAGLLTLAILFLLYFLILGDFRLAYVTTYTSLSLSPLYAISALWAGQEGSLLLWAWLLSLSGTAVVRRIRNSTFGLAKHNAANRRNEVQIDTLSFTECAYIALVFAVVLGFFLMILIISANPFQLLAEVPGNGLGLNPLLQNIYMAIHPPILFLGYAGFAASFVLAFAALCTGKLRKGWVQEIRRWTLLSWYFLGIGILLGARWAYLELGWGGYWSWDPVENTSFIPWLTSTALLHTLLLQQRRGWLKNWNIFLCILNFTLCVFGTFITRSGILTSVHAFTQSTIGGYFGVLLAVIFLCSLGLFLYRRKGFKTQGEVTAFVSKETSLLFTNQLLLGFAFAVLYGTAYPLFSDIVLGRKTTIDPPFFNLIALILGFMLLGLTGLCQQITWKRISAKTLGKNVLLPSLFALGGMLVVGFRGERRPVVLLTITFVVFVITALGIRVGNRLSRDRNLPAASSDGRKIASIWSRFVRRKRRLVGTAFHLGTVFIFFGIALSSVYKTEHEVRLLPGASETIGLYRFRYVRLGQKHDPQKSAIFAEIEVFKAEKRIGTVEPEIRFYEGEQQTTEIGLLALLNEDVYVILAGWDEEDLAVFEIILTPMLNWMWLGGFLIFTLGMLLML